MLLNSVPRPSVYHVDTCTVHQQHKSPGYCVLPSAHLELSHPIPRGLAILLAFTRLMPPQATTLATPPPPAAPLPTACVPATRARAWPTRRALTRGASTCSTPPYPARRAWWRARWCAWDPRVSTHANHAAIPCASRSVPLAPRRRHAHLPPPYAHAHLLHLPAPALLHACLTTRCAPVPSTPHPPIRSGPVHPPADPGTLLCQRAHLLRANDTCEGLAMTHFLGLGSLRAINPYLDCEAGLEAGDYVCLERQGTAPYGNVLYGTRFRHYTGAMRAML